MIVERNTIQKTVFLQAFEFYLVFLCHALPRGPRQLYIQWPPWED